VQHDDLLALFRRSGALLDGHFRLTSGLHSPRYLQSALVLSRPSDAEALASALAPRVAGLGATVVLSPALGGIVIGHEVARALGIRAIFAERQERALTLRRGFTLSPDDRVLVVEDVVTTGGSTRETMEVARAAGATVVGAASIGADVRPCQLSALCPGTAGGEAGQPGVSAKCKAGSAKCKVRTLHFALLILHCAFLRYAASEAHSRLRRHCLCRVAAAG
jgi:orotate phosphoribosyltransferase